MGSNPCGAPCLGLVNSTTACSLLTFFKVRKVAGNEWLAVCLLRVFIFAVKLVSRRWWHPDYHKSISPSGGHQETMGFQNPFKPPTAPPAFAANKVLPEQRASYDKSCSVNFGLSFLRFPSRLIFQWIAPFLDAGFIRPLEKEG